MVEHKLDQLLAEVALLKEQLAGEPESRFKQVLYVCEKLVVPVMLGVLAWTGNQAATKISEAQLQLAQSAEQDRKVDSKRGLQAKYIEIFYAELNSGNQAKQLNAIRLVELAEPELAKSLLAMVAATPGVSQAVVERAAQVQNNLIAVEPFKDFKIGIYYYRSDPGAKNAVARIRQRLAGAGFSGAIQEYPNDDAFFKRVLAPVTQEVRYERGAEDEAAAALLGVLRDSDAKHNWKLLEVTTHTPSFLSLFLPVGS